MEEKIEVARGRCNAVIRRINKLPLSKITSSSKSTLLRLANSELTFLSSLSLSPKPFSCNIGYIEAIVHILEHPYITKVSRVCKPISLPSVSSDGERGRGSGQREAVYVDVVCSLNNDPAWFVVSDRNPKYITWESSGRNKGLKMRIEQIVDFARSAEALKPSLVVLYFANGLEVAVLEELQKYFGFSELGLGFPHFEFGFDDTSEGEWVNVVAKSYQAACTLGLQIEQHRVLCHSVEYSTGSGSGSCGDRKELLEACDELTLGFSFISLISELQGWPPDVEAMEAGETKDLLRDGDVVNFDTTALIAIISGISNGGAKRILGTPENELRQRFKSNTEFVISQAKSEIESHIHDELSCILSAKKGIVCKTVHSEFKDIVSMCGGANEQMRADRLLKLLKIVPDCPSPRMMSLPTTRKLALKNKISFGTGDFWGAPTLTANVGFLRAISQTAMPLFTIEHRPRALIGD